MESPLEEFLDQIDLRVIALVDWLVGESAEITLNDLPRGESVRIALIDLGKSLWEVP